MLNVAMVLREKVPQIDTIINLHSAVALLVRPYEYIIGRLNGKFSVILHYIDVRAVRRRTTMFLLIPFTGSSIAPTSTAADAFSSHSG
jgi:hypothetical protein